MELTPTDLDPRQRYRLMISTIVPRPIALVSTISPAGDANLAPYSFFTGIGSDPMSLLFCPGSRPEGGEKDTLRNCKPVAEGGTGEFVVNVAVEGYRFEVSAAAEPLPWGESEFELTGLATAPSRVVAPPRVAASPVVFECRTLQVVRMRPRGADGPNVVLGEVVHIHLRDGLADARMHVDPDQLAAIGRMGGLSYCFTRDRFDMPRGRPALDARR